MKADILSLIPNSYETIYKEMARKYSPEIETIKINSKEYFFLKPGDITSALSSSDIADSLDFPYWVKIWDASVILGEFLVATKDIQSKKTLELGAGLGVSGIIAADNGYDVTITDYQQDILNFSRISAHLNKLDNVRCQLLDWQKPEDLGKFDLIIGSELIYHKKLFEPLINIMKKYLAPEGIIYLAQDSGRKSLKEFLELCSIDFNIGIKKRKISSNDGHIEILLIKLTMK